MKQQPKYNLFELDEKGNIIKQHNKSPLTHKQVMELMSEVDKEKETPNKTNYRVSIIR